MPPTIPINHYFGPRNQQNRTKVLFYYSMLMYSSEFPDALSKQYDSSPEGKTQSGQYKP